ERAEVVELVARADEVVARWRDELALIGLARVTDDRVGERRRLWHADARLDELGRGGRGRTDLGEPEVLADRTRHPHEVADRDSRVRVGEEDEDAVGDAGRGIR